jgi:hypothetical protein
MSLKVLCHVAGYIKPSIMAQILSMAKIGCYTKDIVVRTELTVDEVTEYLIILQQIKLLKKISYKKQEIFKATKKIVSLLSERKLNF